MKVTEVPYEIDPATMTGGVGEEFESPAPRSSGIHQSHILRDIENRVLKPGERRPYDDLTPAERKRMGNYTEMGFIWEVVVESVWKRRMASRRKPEGVIRQPELCTDNIYQTLDGVLIPSYELDEYKATWLSSSHPVDGPKFWYWHRAMMGYLHGIDRFFRPPAPTRVAHLFVFYVNGDYRESGPQTKRFRIEYNNREIEDNWSMITRHAASMLAARKGGK